MPEPKSVALILALFVGTLPVGELAAGQVGLLTKAEIEEAIALGVSRAPDPYVVMSAESSDTSFGLIFTPFLRVQFAAHDTWRRETRRLMAEEIPAQLLAPEIHIVTSVYTVDLPCTEHPPRFEVHGRDRVPLIVHPVHGTVGQRGIPPLWERRGLETLEQYGAASILNPPDLRLGRPPEEGHWMVVAYPPDFIRAEVDFVVVWGAEIGATCRRRGRIAPAQQAAWR